MAESHFCECYLVHLKAYNTPLKDTHLRMVMNVVDTSLKIGFIISDLVIY